MESISNDASQSISHDDYSQIASFTFINDHWHPLESQLKEQANANKCQKNYSQIYNNLQSMIKKRMKAVNGSP